MTLDRSIEEESLIGHYAGIISRLSAFILDTVILASIILFTSWFVVASWKMLQLEPIIKQLQTRSWVFKNLIELVNNPIFYSLVMLLFVSSYHILFWVIAGQTPGKGILGLRVLPRQGGKLKLSRAVLRYLGFYLSIIPLGLGILWILVDDRRMAWHDKLSGTYVVYAWEAKPDQTFLAVETSKIIARTQALRKYLDKRSKAA